MKLFHFPQYLALLVLLLSNSSTNAQDFCASDILHERLMDTDNKYASRFEAMNELLATKILTKALDLDNSTVVTIPLVIHVMHTGDAVGTAYNPSDSDINDMIDGLNDFYANDNGLGLDINLQFVLAKRNESCATTTGINRVDASGVTDYSSGGIDIGSGTGADEATVKALSKWNNTDYYNVWIVNRLNGHDGTTPGTFTAGFAYYPIANSAIDGTVMLASQLDPTDITLAHEIGHALNLAHTFNGDDNGSSCPTDTDCTTDGDYCCDTPAHMRNAFSCITSGNTCTSDPVGDVYKNFMAYSGCQDRFTDDQRTRMRAALELLRPGLVNSLGDELPPATSTTAADCAPGLNNTGNFGIGPKTFDFGDERTYTPTQGSYGYTHYHDFTCNQMYTVYPGQEVAVGVETTGGNGHRVRIYIDYDNNGDLTDTGEDAYSASNGSAPFDFSGTVTISSTATTEVPLRMRLWADFVGSGGANGPCGNLGYGQAIDHSIYVENVDVWEGTTSTDWNAASNWAKGTVPTSSGNVRIPSTAPNQPSITIAAVCNDLEIQSGASLTIEAGKSLTASGNTDNDGTMLIEADATGIGSFIDNGTIAGSGIFQMEQYLSGAGGATPNGFFHYVASPMASATSAVYNAAGTDKIWSANEVTQSYSQISNNSSNLNVLEGYVARMGASGAVTYTGGLYNTGNQSATGLTRTGNSQNNRGYNLVGNPYPSSVSWDDATKTNLMSTMWYRTNQGSSMLYDTYNATGMVGTNNNGGGAVTGDIAPTQAFWVRVDADGNTGQLDFTNAMRSHGSLTSIYKLQAEEGMVRMKISNGENSDEAIVQFNTDAENEFESYDSQKFWANLALPQIYTSVGEDTLVINGLYSTESNPVVDLGLKLPIAGEYTISSPSISLTQSIHLEDRFLGVFQNLNEQPDYAFSSANAGNISSRFALHFGLSITDIDNQNKFKSTIYSSRGMLNILLPENIENGQVEVVDITGRTVFISSLNTNKSTLDLEVNSGVYLVSINTDKSTETHRIFLER